MVGTTSEINRHVKLYHSANFHAGITFCTLSTKFAAMPLDYSSLLFRLGSFSQGQVESGKVCTISMVCTQAK